MKTIFLIFLLKAPLGQVVPRNEKHFLPEYPCCQMCNKSSRTTAEKALQHSYKLYHVMNPLKYLTLNGNYIYRLL